MPIHKNPAREAIEKMRTIKDPDGNPLYTEAEIQAQLARLELNEKDLPEFQITGEAKEKPVTTLTSYTDFDESLAAKLGGVTVAHKVAANDLLRQIDAREKSKLLDSPLGGGEAKK
jgi:hypothetical protein